MATQSDREIAKGIVIAWLDTQVNPATEAKSKFSGTDAQKNGEYIGEVYKAVLKVISQGE